MSNRVFIIHGWDDSPEGSWFPWLKKKLVKQGIEAHVPAMPDPANPTIDIWVPFLKHVVGQADEQTFMVGHSIGCQAILRYLETLSAGAKIGGVVLVAGWVTLKPEALPDEDYRQTARPWLTTPINWGQALEHCPKFACIFSVSDPYVPIDNARVFADHLHIEPIEIPGPGHLLGEDGVTELPVVLETLDKLTKFS